jgi:undecaprenyl-diphosphatase
MQPSFPETHAQPPARRNGPRAAFLRGVRFIERHVRGSYTGVVLSMLLPFAVGVAAVTAFVLLGDVVIGGATREFDEAVLRWAAQRRSPALDSIMRDITALGSATVLLLLAGAAATFLWLTRHHLSALLLALAVVAAAVLNLVLKALYDRPRPDVVPWVVEVVTPSFPSGHALGAFAIYGTLAYLVGRLEPARRLRTATWIIAALIILAVGVSRVYLGVHYPSDVLAGFIVAVAWIGFAAAGVTAFTTFARRRPELRREEPDPPREETGPGRRAEGG